jgi:hypothetical protein
MVVKERHVSTSSLEADTQSNPIFEVLQSNQSSGSDPVLANSVLVPMILNMKHLDHPIMMRTEK